MTNSLLATDSVLRIALVVADTGIPVFGNKGASVHVRAMANAFATLGHDVTIVAARRRHGGTNAVAAPIVEAKLPADARAVFALTEAADVGLVPELAEVARFLLSRAIEDEIMALHAARPLDMIYERLSLWSYAGIAAGRRLGVPVLIEADAHLVTEQERYRSLALKTLAQGVERHVLSTADAVFAVSDPLARDLIGAGARPERMHVLSNGVDPDCFHPGLDGRAARAVWGVADDELVVGFVGSLRPWHGVEDVVAALADAGNPQLRLVVVGDGPMRERCEQMAASLPGRATFTGAVPHEQVPTAVAAFDVAVAPYAPDAEAYFSPLKAFEYAAAGRAIIAAGGGQVESLFPSDAVVLYPPGDRAALAAGISRLAADPIRRAVLGRAASRFVLGHHTWADNARRVVTIAAGIMEPRSAA